MRSAEEFDVRRRKLECTVDVIHYLSSPPFLPLPFRPFTRILRVLTRRVVTRRVDGVSSEAEGPSGVSTCVSVLSQHVSGFRDLSGFWGASGLTA